MSHEWIYRLYRGLGLAVPQKRRMRASQAAHEALPAAAAQDVCWSTNFPSDSMTEGLGLQSPAVVDDHSKAYPELGCDVSLPAGQGLRMLEQALETGRRAIFAPKTAPD